MRERRWLRGARKGSPARQHPLGTFLRAAADQSRRGTPGRAVEKPQRGSCGGTEVTSARGKRAARPGPVRSAQLRPAQVPPQQVAAARRNRAAGARPPAPGSAESQLLRLPTHAQWRRRWDLPAAGVGDGSWTACLASGLRGL